jgi:hypothetical protein
MATYNEHGFITALEPHEVFVFGSNLAGRHGAGAAKQAREQFGAQLGVGEGRTGQTYALPTLDENLKQLSYKELALAAERFISYAWRNPNTVFHLTKVGCGLAGYDEERIKVLFAWTPRNVVKPEGW